MGTAASRSTVHVLFFSRLVVHSGNHGDAAWIFYSPSFIEKQLFKNVAAAFENISGKIKRHSKCQRSPILAPEVIEIKLK